MKEKKTEYIIMKATPSFKARAFDRAHEEGRSLSNYIEWLINNDAKRREEDDKGACDVCGSIEGKEKGYE